MKQTAQKVNGKSRYNLNEHFEDVYLRSRTLRRFMDKVDHKMMADQDTRKVIEHLTDRQMGVYGKIFSWNGFDRDDIRSIVSLFASCFTGFGIKKKSKRGYYYLMMRFVQQRMEFFVRCVIRKFHVDDTSCQNVIHSRLAPTLGDDTSLLEFLASSEAVAQFLTGFSAEPEQSYRERAEEVEDQIEILKIRHQDAIDSCRPEQEVEAYRRAVDRLTNVAQSYRQEANKEIRKERALTAALKKRLSEDPQRYADQLSYYATYKGIPYDVRRAARKICKRHGIDFVAWVKDHTNLVDGDDMCYNVR